MSIGGLGALLMRSLANGDGPVAPVGNGEVAEDLPPPVIDEASPRS